jgi:hypothetical protein
MIHRMRRYAWPALPAVMLAALCLGFAATARTVQKPKTVLQVVTIRWASEAAPEQRKAALEGMEKLGAEIPGVKSMWLRTVRVQPRDYMTAFAIEFEDQPAADRFSRHAAYEAWSKTYLPVIEDTRIQQVSN